MSTLRVVHGLNSGGRVDIYVHHRSSGLNSDHGFTYKVR